MGVSGGAGGKGPDPTKKRACQRAVREKKTKGEVEGPLMGGLLMEGKGHLRGCMSRRGAK